MLNKITRYIDKKLRDEYYNSLGRKTPYAFPTNEIIDNILYSKKHHPILFKVEKKLSNLQFFIERCIEKFKRPIIYYKNAYRDQTHVIQTGLKKGYWYEPCDRIEHGLFKLIELFVKEDNEGIKYYNRLVETASLEELKQYPESQIECYETCQEVLRWRDVTLKQYEAEIELLYGTLKRTKTDDPDISPWTMFNEPDDIKLYNKAIRVKIWEIEDKIMSERKLMLKKIIDIYDQLWT